MNLNSRGSIDPRLIKVAQKPLDGFLNCKIELLDMHLDMQGANYNWKTNANSSPEPTILFAGDAQMQVFRFTLTMDAPVGSVDQVRSARFTINHADIVSVDIRKGQMIRVTECPNDETLERYQYVVNSGFNSGWAFRRTIETEVDMARVVS